MTNHCIIKATFNILPQESDKTNYYINDPKVGMNKLGDILKQVFPHTLYSYQIEAMKTVLTGNDLFLTVGTGAGKTEAFMFPILNELLEEKATNVIIIYPTKQLAADQEQRLAQYCNQILEATGRTITYSRYNGDLSKQDLEQIEKKKPQILLATLDKLFYRCFKEDKHGFLDWIKQTDMLVLDEIHAGSGGYLTHIREFIDVFKKINPKLQVILASATVKDVSSFRDNFLPSAKIVQAVGKRGVVRVMILPKSSLERFIFDRIDPHLQRTGGVCLVFVDNIQKVSQLVATFNERLVKRTGLPLEVVKLNSPFVCINSQLTEQDKTNIHKRIKNGSLRFLFSTSLLELGMDLPKVEHIVNIGWPITGKNGLLQRFGRLRFRDITQKKNFTIILDTEQPLDNFYLENYRIIRTILEENIAEQILFDSKSLQRLKAFILFRISMGHTTSNEILSYCQTVESEQTTKTAITLLLASGIIRTRNCDTNNGKQELVIADEKELHFFIRNHKIRSIEQRWLVIEQKNKTEFVVGEIEEQRILRMALPGNLLFLGSHGDVYRVLQIVEGKVFVEKLTVNKSTIEYNKLKAPVFQISQQARVQKTDNLIIRFGRMVIQKETAVVIRYSRTGEKIDPTHQHKQSYHWQEKTSGMLVEVIFPSKKVGYKIKKDTLTLLRDLLLKSAEITHHISEPSFRTAINVYEGKLAIYDKGGELGNTAYLFREFHKVMKQARKILQSTSNNQSSQIAIFPFIDQTSAETLGMIRSILAEKTMGDLET